ncbi:MAG TPA: YciI family protein [Streptosporangiaceae bacterium]
MTQYLLSIYQPDGVQPPEDIDEIMAKVGAWKREVEAAGAWVFTGGLYPPGTATVLRPQPDGSLIITDGPFAEGKEHVGGFTVIRAADLDEALSWGRKFTEITRLPVEVRPVIGD